MRLTLQKHIYGQILDALNLAEQEGLVVLSVVLTKAERHALYKFKSGKVYTIFGIPIEAEDE